MSTSRFRIPQTSRSMVLALIAWTLATAGGGGAQELQDLKKPATPPGFAIPRQRHRRRRHRLLRRAWVWRQWAYCGQPDVRAVQGAAVYETTSDGRMGWEEYFVRKGHAVYLPDQVSRARSGFDPTVFSRVHAGVALPS